MDQTGKEHLSSTAAGVGSPQSQKLPESLRHEMQTSLGADLSQVRVHISHGPTMVGAQAFTKGSDIYFAPGTYEPHSPEGKKLISHELSHVVQQKHSKSEAPEK